MKNIRLKYCLFFILFISNIAYSQDANQTKYNTELASQDWNLKFNDSGKRDWSKNWFLDGLRADIQNTREGMIFTAGPIVKDDACHAVLWTKKSFAGDMKIEYEYTRTDCQKSQVNILYIQATGVAPFDKDISTWTDFRTIPHMKTYFNNMKCLHISYAAFDEKGEYVRLRKYPVEEGKDFNTTTEITPAFFNTSLFLPGETYKVTIVKSSTNLYFNVQGKNISKLYTWSLDPKDPIVEGRVGLRHMYTRSARYKNIKIYCKK